LVHLGITPIIAHPERNTAIASKPQLARRLVEAGALLQVNASSLRSRHETREAAKYLLTHGYVHFVATDCHGVYARRPSLGKYVDMLAEWLGPEQAQKLVKDHPAAVLAGARLEPPRILERQGLGARLLNVLRGRLPPNSGENAVESVPLTADTLPCRRGRGWTRELGG